MTDTLNIAPPATVAKELARSPELWWPRVRRSEGRRWYEPLLATEDFEAWLLGWPVGGGIELPDHGASCGALIVVEGSLAETYVDAAEWAGSGRRHRLHHRLLPT